MAVAARAIEKVTHRRPELTLVHGSRAEQVACRRPSASAETVYRDVVRILIAVLMVGVILGMGPVWLTTEAARLAKQTAIIKQDIMREADTTQQLQMERYQVASTEQIERFAVDTLGMVPVNGDVTVVDIGGVGTVADASTAGEASAAQPAQSGAAEWVATIGSGDALGALAQLASGEAQVLLVGDIGLTAAR